MKLPPITLILIHFGLSLITLNGFARERPRGEYDNGTLTGTMSRGVEYYVRVPLEYDSNPDKVYPVLYAMHGLGSSATGWVDTALLVEAMNNGYPAVVVTFFGGPYWYVDAPGNEDIQYKTFFFNELVPFIQSNYRVGTTPNMRAVTGYSMGGFGAWHYMTEKPDFFGSVSAVAGALDRAPSGSSNDTYTRLNAIANNNIDLPPTQLWCGTADGLITTNRNMKQYLIDHGYSSEIIEEPGGTHLYWQSQAAKILKWHFKHFEVEKWRELPVSNHSSYTNAFGWINASASDPWGWVYNLNQWVYLPNNLDLETGGWVYIRK